MKKHAHNSGHKKTPVRAQMSFCCVNPYVRTDDSFSEIILIIYGIGD